MRLLFLCILPPRIPQSLNTLVRDLKRLNDRQLNAITVLVKYLVQSNCK